ncbi:uncharacterized protein (DUF885 family) [Sphingobium sp. B1D7B]|uniref:DUF885 domain-containing protein n=1 Tax=unclassified Sphingobium TaxID=2611147 RepID=UPI00222536C9|nr:MULTISPECIES: DUF885 domain-containing protein [unclassified Sphingobium]MCW2391386.1 uncharacterized protein (DUF885 family) [Sphingobium sp. B11D3A]MCW2406597.1 uncharacterized protein (DUF885 family) [Sphingobium sp. B1D7B]
MFRAQRLTRSLSLLLAATAFATPLLAQTPAAQPAGQTASSEDQRLTALFARANEATLANNPLDALFRGDMRHADRMGDYISDAYFATERKIAQDNLAALHAVNRDRLNAQNKIAYDVFEWEVQDKLTKLSPPLVNISAVIPINHFTGLHTFYPTLSSGKGAAPFKTLADYENNLKRHKDYVRYLDRAIGRFREGMASGVVETKLTIGNTISQLDALLAQPVDESPFYQPVKDFPEDIAPADRQRLTKAYRDALINEINPAQKRLRDFLKADYLPVAREGVGLSAMKGGAELYAALVKSMTTLPLTPDYIHNLGLSEVARIRSEMEQVRDEVGFKGTLGAFFTHLREAPEFHPKSREWMTEEFYRIGKIVDEKVPSQFSTLPKAKLEIRPYPEFREKFEAGGSYENGTPDGTRPGVFYFNAYDLPSRSIPGMTTLYLHEGAPGHHFQISLAQENASLPDFIRFGGNTAYVEGWALYAETLGYDFGLFKDPYQRMGHLDDEMLRAMRLVVDTGIHAKGWTRDQAIAYMLDNSSMGKTDATAEVERYIAMPAQALSYKIGALTIQRLKKKAQAALGDRFDVKAFHDQVLMTGALPMSVLERKIDDWIAHAKAR